MVSCVGVNEYDFGHTWYLQNLNIDLLLLVTRCRTHPYFISKEAYAELIDETGLMNKVTTANWVKETINSWRHTIWKGAKDPRGWIFKPKSYIKTFRDAYCIERMHRAFKRSLMEYGMFHVTKKES
jgi:MPBQ/MSBQ methyltransferase